MRQEAENAILEMRMRCEAAENAAEQMRSDCEHMLAMGTEQGTRIGLLQEEVARMQEERKGSAGEVKSLAGNLRQVRPRASQGISARRFRA